MGWKGLSVHSEFLEISKEVSGLHFPSQRSGKPLPHNKTIQKSLKYGCDLILCKRFVFMKLLFRFNFFM